MAFASKIKKILAICACATTLMSSMASLVFADYTLSEQSKNTTYNSDGSFSFDKYNEEHGDLIEYKLSMKWKDQDNIDRSVYANFSSDYWVLENNRINVSKNLIKERFRSMGTIGTAVETELQITTMSRLGGVDYYMPDVKKKITFNVNEILEASTIYFDAMGGTCSKSNKTVIYGEIIGNMPIPERPGLTFKYWYIDDISNPIYECNLWTYHEDKTLKAYYITKDLDSIKTSSKKQYVDYKKNATLTVYVNNVPEGFNVAIKVGNETVVGDRKSVTINLGQITEDVSYTIYFEDIFGNKLIDTSGETITRQGTIKVNDGFFMLILSYIRDIFGIEANVSIESKP